MKNWIVVGTLALMVMLAACGWFSANQPAVETAVGQVASCVLGQVLSGDEDPLVITAACAGATLADVTAIVESIINFYEAPSADGGAPPAAPAGLLPHLHALRDHAKAAVVNRAR